MRKFLFMCLKFGIILAVLIILGIIAPCIEAAEFSVPDDFNSIQAAIDGAGNGDVITVGPGTYYENINFFSKAITIKSIDPNDQDVVESTIIQGSGSNPVVKFENAEGNDSFLNGLTIQRENTSSYSGISCNNASPSINKCIIRGNYYAVYCDGSSVCINRCTINGNGKGVYCKNFSSPVITNCTISKNTYGAVDCRESSSPTISNCIIKNNTGDGICCYQSSPIITNCIITRNKGGRGIYCNDFSSPHIMNCIISENFSYRHNGGGIFCSNNSSPLITNCIISKNSVQNGRFGGGAGIYCGSFSNPIITNCTFSGNWTPGTGAAGYFMGNLHLLL